jgi:hypothetical protein
LAVDRGIGGFFSLARGSRYNGLAAGEPQFRLQARATILQGLGRRKHREEGVQRFPRSALAGLVFALLYGAPAAAVETKEAKPNSASHLAKPASPDTRATVATSPAQAIPNGPRLRLLIYTTLIAINQANQTGNYSVLRDLAAPGFREANSSARLAEIFSKLRQKNIDLSPVIFLEPRLIRPPSLMENGMLRLSGYIPSAPEQVNFDLAFQRIEGRWLLFGVGVNTSAAATDVSEVPGAGAPGAAKPEPDSNSKR